MTSPRLELPALPAVSFIMPVLNEAEYLEPAVRTVLAQEYPGEKEIILALGPSTDGTTEIARRLAAEDPRVRLVDNPDRDIPVALNLAIAASRHPVVIRVDAHSELTPDYAARGIESLREQDADNVGGIMRAAGRGAVQSAIARGYNSPFGLGGGAYHGDGVPGPAESAYLGVFRRDAIERAGGFDPGIRRGEDWELNLRIRRTGGRIWFDPRLQVTYWPRASFDALARQFFATGAWRAVLVRRYGRANPWRFFVPGALVLGVTVDLAVLVLQCCGVLPWWSLWSALHLGTLGYLAGVLLGIARMPEQRGIRDRMLSFRTLVTMHFSWGAGFLKGILFGGGRTVDRSRTE
ncbi:MULTISPECIES: glycosyltransferase family 2 protein [unclassified Leucobacter]|uniref:glycosyltransferase family 2 protein n=1 Tax=unclassified Leucobacter TaxID=2621730 RepID=UPI000B2AA98D|nr:glycosyltransferase family 2 protein [Leucobacter sp. Ag1]